MTSNYINNSWVPRFLLLFAITVLGGATEGFAKGTFTDFMESDSLQATVITSYPSCNGFPGTMAVLVSGGTTPYTIVWSNGITGPVASDLYPGVDSTVLITDASGAQLLVTFSVPVIDSLSVSILTGFAACIGVDNGTASAFVSPQGGAYQYAWNVSPLNSSKLTGLPANTGVYVTVTDINSGCTGMASDSILPHATLALDIDSSGVIQCPDDLTGSLEATASGGTFPFSYAWTGPGGTTFSGATLTGLGSGTYTVTATDASGCTITGTKTLHSISALKAAISLSQSCADNIITVSFSDQSTDSTSTIDSWAWTITWGNNTLTDTTANVPSFTLPHTTTGTAQLIVTTEAGCRDTILQPFITRAFPDVSVATPGFTCDSSAVPITVTGSDTLNYAWSPSDGLTFDPDPRNVMANPPATTVYTLVVSDNSCFDTITPVEIIRQPALTLGKTTTNSSCGNSTGSIDLTVTGGVPPYTVKWSNGSMEEDINNLPVGTYTVTVTDSLKCTQTTTATILNVDGPDLLLNVTNTLCNGDSTGAIDLTVTGGAPGYTYVWSNGSTLEDITDLPAGIYTVTVTDAGNCTAVASATVEQPPALMLSATATNATCGNSNGSISLTVSGGTPGYTYLWSNGSTQKDLSNLPAGVYTVTVTDANGCTKTREVVVNNTDGPQLSVEVTPVALCHGDLTGSIDLTVTGGTSPYTYAWSNGSTEEDIDNLPASMHTVTVTDATGCTATITATVIEPFPLELSFSITDVALCNGDSTGAIDLTVMGGTPGYTYAWSTGSTDEDINNLPAGTYTVTVTDANGCTATISGTVQEPPGMTLEFNVTDVALCYGDSTGSIDLTVTNGTPGYTYLWTTGSTDEDINNLPAGTYTVTVTDANGCTTTGSATVEQPPALNLSVTTTNSTCGSPTGSIDLTVSGGTPGYTYAWSNGSDVEDPADLPADTYTVTVTDANGCTATTSATIMNLDGPMLSLSVTDVLCYGDSTGSIDLTVTGGTPAYTYLWTNGSTGEDQNNLPAGTYTVTVTDANGCTATSSATVEQQPALDLSVMLTDVALCNGDSTGAIDLTVTGGTPGYTYVWSTGSTDEDINNLPSGTYTVTVTDANGCTATISGTVQEPPGMTLDFNVTNVALCYGDSTGAIDLTVTDGTPGYTYVWSTGSTDEDINNLPAGTYTVTVTDANGCTTTGSATVEQPPALNLSVTTTNSTCGSPTGSIDLTVSGGTPGYTYAWSTGSDVEDLTDLPADTYTVTVTDANGCTATTSATIMNLDGPMLSLSATDVLCNGDSTGSIDLTVTGGTPAYTYVWTTGSTEEDQNNLPAGTYTVTVTDANGCTATSSATIEQPPALDLSVMVTDVALCNGDSTGAIDLTVAGGTSPYTYLWTTGSTDEDINNLPAGTYTVTVTDANGCTATISASVMEPEPMTLEFDVTNVALCYGDSTGQIDLTVTGGTAPYTYQWSNGPTTEDIGNLPAGAYTVTVTDATGCTTTGTATVEQPPALDLSVTTTNSTCGSPTGSIDLTVTGGTPGYTYLWSNGSDVEDPADLPADTYTVTVTDANGCTATTSATIMNLDGPMLSLSATDVLCNGDSTGSIDLTVTGGTPAYTYVWTTGSTEEDQNNLPAGTYTVTVTDANSCTATISGTVLEPQAITLEFMVTNVALCYGDSTGALDLIVNGGTSPFTYAWSTGSSDEDITNLPAGLYTVTVTDANNCTAAASATVGQPSAIELSATPVNSVCGSSTGSIDLMVTGGTPDYTYLWSNSIDFEDPTDLAAGTYTVTVTDTNGCTATTSATVEATGLEVTAVGDTTCAPAGMVSATANLPATFTWTNAQGNVINPDAVPTGTYMVVGTDTTGVCSDTAFASVIAAPAAIDAFAPSTGCAGEPVDLTAENLIPGDIVSYVWTASPTSLEINDPSAKETTAIGPNGTYTVIVVGTNQAGCTATDSLEIEIVSVSVTVETDQDTVCSGQSTTLHATASSTGPATDYTYSWSPAGTLTGADTPNPVATPDGPTTYTVTVTSDDFCTATASVTIYFRETQCRDPYIFVPKAFTPNGDGNNDFFRVRGTDISEILFIVYDRWGEEVYRTEVPEHIGWDGTYRGKASTPDSYAWYLEVKCGNGDRFVSKGNVTLLK